ncbi:MAG TPA: ATP-binding cassette domain-containing protein, partial [Chthoniobacterales bacterium]|nr:ATP-binding cassette domain-containing protein [Chthoniobacterales bacterium]
HIERRSLEIHRLQAATLLAPANHRMKAVRQVTRGEVVFRNVSFSYGSLDRLVLNDVSFRICEGECTIIRGPSGAGKSTIAKLLSGQLEPTRGAIEVDGAPLADIMNGMAAVLQSDRLVTGTIRENIAFFRRGIADEEITEALQIAALDDFVLNLPMGLSTQVGETMAGLSGGQRQRLLIARAVLRKPKLLILDEATSSLEIEVESQIFGKLRSVGSSMLVIAHRPEVWRLADQILAVDGDGRLIDDLPDRPVSMERDKVA